MQNIKTKNGFTIIELLVALGLFAAVIAAAGMIFNYSLESQRIAAATAEIMRTLRAITDQINIDFQGLQKDGYLILYSQQVNPPADTNNLDALYYFSTGDYQSWDTTSDIRSNIARIFLGHSRSTYGPPPKLPGNFARDMHLLTPGYSGPDYNDVNGPADIVNLENPNTTFFITDRPDANSTNIGSLFSQNVGSFKIEWTDDNPLPPLINWYGGAKRKGGNTFEDTTTGYLAYWSPLNSDDWPKALKFTFMLYDSKRILKGGRTFEYIVYIER